METVKMVSACDSRYAQHLGVMFTSLLENTSFKKSVEFYVIDGGISEGDKELLSLCTLLHGCKINFISIQPEFYMSFGESPSASTATYFRIFVPELLGPDIEKVIYLDCDIVVKKDITELWKVDVSQYFLAAVVDCGIEDSGMYAVKLKRKLGMKRKDCYFNAGVLVMNLSKWREENISRKISEFLVENDGNIEFADQDGLNAILCNRWLQLYPQWNQQVAHCELFEQGKLTSENSFEAAKDPWIIHYTTSQYTGTKPWNYMNMHPYRSEYYRYLDMTPWKNFIPSDRTILNIALKTIYETSLGKLSINYYRRNIKSTYCHETAWLPKKLTRSLWFKLVYLLVHPFISYYVKDNQKQEKAKKGKYTCPCCGFKTLEKEPPNTEEVCEICGWEYDFYQLCNPDDNSGANEVSLNQARKNFLEFGASEKKFRYVVRRPNRYDKKKREAVDCAARY
ncbi:MAG TPA: glycosyltransferase [Ruminiclostridium sp.]|nr:glycosyltransferase [Ruminiclostridium sp.]